MLKVQEWVRGRVAPPEFVASQSHLDPIVARILYARHIDTPELIRAFFATDGPLGDPLSLLDMPVAVERILRAIQAGEKVVVYGDFDVDGVTATVLLTSVLRALGAHADPYIPDRFEEGYGLNTGALGRLRAQGYTLCVTVDCGIRSVSEVASAQADGLDMVITDHHSVAGELPLAVALVNPRRTGDGYGYPDLSGVAIAYQLSRALVGALQDSAAGVAVAGTLDSYLDLVAVGTIADVAPLAGENRTITRWGLDRLRSSARPGLSALALAAGVSLDAIDSGDVAFRLAPRLNAAGRIEHARLAYDVLMAASLEEATRNATELNRLNRDRQALLEQQVAEAIRAIDEEHLPPILVIDGPGYHEGIVGLIASRLRERYYRPAVVLRSDGETSRGSARSVDGFHITEALESCRDLLLRFGGHAQAAGFTLDTVHVREFRERLLAYGASHLDADILTPRLHVDAIVDLADVVHEPDRGKSTPLAIAALGPFGRGNPEPLLATLGVVAVDVRRIGQNGSHLRLDIAHRGVPRSCIGFRQGEEAGWLTPGTRIDLVYRPSVNTWNGRESLQLVIEAVRPAR